MADPATTELHMTADQFMAWYDRQPEGRRFELFNGRVYEMQSERAAHARVKANAFVALRRAIAEKGLPCEAFQDGMAVRVDDETIFEPDALVRCGPRLPPEAVLIVDPMIVIEVLSPTRQHVDVFRKFTGYFRNPAITHYLILNSVDKNLVHHRRNAAGRVESESVSGGALNLDPPGLVLEVAELFADID